MSEKPMEPLNKQSTFIDAERQNLLVFIWQKRKLIGLISLGTALVSFILSLLITPLYKSTAIVFPAATSTVSFSEQRNAKAAAMDFGEEEQAEQLVQILQSSRIRDKIVAEFDLVRDYEIEENDANKNYKLVNAYNNHFSFFRTRFGSIEIDVLDKSPAKAAKMANKIVDLIDTVKNTMVAERTWPAFEINKRKKELLESDLNTILSELDSLGDMGVVTANSRSTLFQAYVDSRSETEKSFLKNKIDINLKFGSRYDGLCQIRDEKVTKLENFLDSYEQAESDANAVFNHKFVVERAVVADKKDQPKRLIIVLLATVGAFLFTVFALLISERVKQLNKNV
jgi:tyrosine-protein kinase Etk/Wzc